MPRSGYDLTGLHKGSRGGKAVERAKLRRHGGATPRATTPVNMRPNVQEDPDKTPRASQMSIDLAQGCVDPRLLSSGHGQQQSGSSMQFNQPSPSYYGQPVGQGNFGPIAPLHHSFNTGFNPNPSFSGNQFPFVPGPSERPSYMSNRGQPPPMSNVPPNGYFGYGGQPVPMGPVSFPPAPQNACSGPQDFIHHSNVMASDKRYAAFNPNDIPPIREEEPQDVRVTGMGQNGQGRQRR